MSEPVRDHLEQLTAIVKERYESGAHGDAHFAMAADLWDHLRAQPVPRPSPWEPIGSRIGDLLSIPIVVDDSLSPGSWRLVGNGERETRASGWIDLALVVPDGR